LEILNDTQLETTRNRKSSSNLKSEDRDVENRLDGLFKFSREMKGGLKKMKQMISEYKTKTKKKFNKKLMIPLMAVFAIGMVFAVGYIVNSLTLTVGVAEAFEIKYAVMGDGGTYTGGTCANESLTWFTSTETSIPTGNFYPMESRAVCVRIKNLGEVAIPYTINSNVTNDDGTKCATAFGLPNTISGSALPGVNYNGKVIQIAANATPVSGCNIVIDVARG
jgi:hypothetical protein